MILNSQHLPHPSFGFWCSWVGWGNFSWKWDENIQERGLFNKTPSREQFIPSLFLKTANTQNHYWSLSFFFNLFENSCTICSSPALQQEEFTTLKICFFIHPKSCKFPFKLCTSSSSNPTQKWALSVLFTHNSAEPQQRTECKEWTPFAKIIQSQTKAFTFP